MDKNDVTVILSLEEYIDRERMKVGGGNTSFSSTNCLKVHVYIVIKYHNF